MIKQLLSGCLLFAQLGLYAQQQDPVEYAHFPSDWEFNSVNTTKSVVGSLPGKPIPLPDGSTGYNFTPKPVDLKGVVLPNNMILGQKW